MSNGNNENKRFSPEMFQLVNHGERISDKKFEDKPIGYMKDAWIRFRKNKASIVAAVIIICIVLYAFLTPLFVTKYDSTFLDPYYAKKGPRVEALYSLGFNGGSTRTFSEKGLLVAIGIGVGAMDYEGNGNITLADSLVDNKYQPMVDLDMEDSYLVSEIKGKDPTLYVPATIDTYLEVGFIYKNVKQAEYQKMLAWQEETGIQLFYPLVEDNEYNLDATNANYWWKSKKGNSVVTTESGSVKTQDFSMDMVLEDNYKRDENGDVIYYEYTGGGNFDTAEFRVRLLYHNYYIYKNGFAPEYFFGTDSQGYDLALRLADGIKLSLLVAVCVSVINLFIGAVYGAIEGYYGGAVDLVMERISDILGGVPFIVVATLFQLHLSAKVGAIPSLLFAFVLTGWLGTASRVRTQFYRFKNQEYVMAARTLGAKDSRLIMKHIFPNSLGTLITSSVLVIPSVIFSESMLSFLGIVKLGGSGVTSLGTLLSDASGIWTNYPHLMLFPAIIISLLMICFNLFGNGLRDAFNPSLRGVEE